MTAAAALATGICVLWTMFAPDEPVAPILAGLALLLLAALLVYARSYVIRMESDASELILTTLGMLSPTAHRIPRGSVERIGSHDGWIDNSIVQAPWLTLRVAGRTLPFVLDLQAERIDRPAIAGLLRRS